MIDTTKIMFVLIRSGNRSQKGGSTGDATVNPQSHRRYMFRTV